MLTAQVAQYAATLENYNKAIQIYEQVFNFIRGKMTLYFLSLAPIFSEFFFPWQVAASALESSLLKYSAKEHFFRLLFSHWSQLRGLYV